MEDCVTVLKEKRELEAIVGQNIGRLLNRLKRQISHLYQRSEVCDHIYQKKNYHHHVEEINLEV